MKNTAEDDLQEEVIEGQNGAVVLAKITFIEKRELLCLQDQDTGESFISCMSVIKADFRYLGQDFYVRCWPENVK